jgi:DNA-binding MarR family transcriptional regulator
MSTAKHPNPESATAGAPGDAERLHSAAIHMLRKLRRLDDLFQSPGSRKAVRPAAETLNPPRISALSVVVLSGPITLGQLAAAEQVRPPTMTRIVHALAAQGLVVKAGDPADRRIVRIAATPRGKRVLLAGRSRRVSALAGAIARLSPTGQEALRRALPTLETLCHTL